IGDFAHLELEKPAHEIGMTARDNNFGAADTVFDRDHISAKAIPYVVVFDDHPLPLRHDGFKFSKIQNDIGTVETPHSSTDNLAPQIARRADALLGGREQGIRHSLEQDFAFNSALPLQVIENGNKFRVHKTCSPQTKKSGTPVPTPISARTKHQR